MKLSEKTLKILTFVAIIIGAILELNGKEQPDELEKEEPKNLGEL
jgi:hypothetical protein